MTDSSLFTAMNAIINLISGKKRILNQEQYFLVIKEITSNQEMFLKIRKSFWLIKSKKSKVADCPPSC